jgi:hypothetical protein
MTGARPLAPGQHAVGATVGGGLVELGAPIPLPNVVVEGRHGAALVAGRPLDVHYGMNATGLAFGLVQGHVGASWLAVDQRGAAPALSVTDRVFFAANALALPSRPEPKLEGWGADQVELTASWRVKGQLPYLSLSQYFDFASPAFTLTPAVGAVFDPGQVGGVSLQTEARWYGVVQPDEVGTVSWVPGSAGILGLTLGVCVPFGGAP